MPHPTCSGFSEDIHATTLPDAHMLIVATGKIEVNIGQHKSSPNFGFKLNNAVKA
jgi:hypothetical protein